MISGGWLCQGDGGGGITIVVQEQIVGVVVEQEVLAGAIVEQDVVAGSIVEIEALAGAIVEQDALTGSIIETEVLGGIVTKDGSCLDRPQWVALIPSSVPMPYTEADILAGEQLFIFESISGGGFDLEFNDLDSHYFVHVRSDQIYYNPLHYLSDGLFPSGVDDLQAITMTDPEASSFGCRVIRSNGPQIAAQFRWSFTP